MRQEDRNNRRQAIYLIQGLGSDEMVFNWVDIPGFEKKYVKWIPPEKNDSLASYSKKLLDQIDSDLPVLMGLSFGGVMAIEIAKHIPCRKVIIISSVKVRKELPLLYRVFGSLKLNKLIPLSYFIRPRAFTYSLFGAEREIEKEMMDRIIESTDRRFAEWAIDKIVNWKHSEKNGNLVHIHGTSDKIFPPGLVTADHFIPGGGHMMVHNKADKINMILENILIPQETSTK